MEGLKDDFKGFGDGFEGFPKRLPEDCVEYSLYIVNAKLTSPRETLAQLETVRKEASKLTENLLQKYIWQRENFSLQVKNKKGLMYLHGLTNYGDSVEDEWLIVYILKELSNLFSDLWIKVADTDGEFLLIEAANALPRWLNPEIADNRVWIHKNSLRIIPLKAATPSTTRETVPISRSLSAEEALEILKTTPDLLINSPLVEAEAFYRLRNYPAQITASMHHANVLIPRKLAFILHELPATISPAVESFYLRDPVALKPLQSLSAGLVFPPVDLITVSIRFTKVLYAQLKSQQFAPPPAWSKIQTTGEEGESPDSSAQRRVSQVEMGMKVTSGFEMLVTDAKNSDSRRVREINILLEDLAADGDSILPTDSEIAKWPEVRREDDEKWLDINFEDFERELDGKNQKQKKPTTPGAFGPEPPPGFGDAKTQADLRKMVERFESFLNDDDAGVDGAEIDDMDIDDDDEDSEEESEDEDEDKDVSFDEREFAKMMREMMGMPPEEDEEGDGPGTNRTKSNAAGTSRIEEVDTDDEDGGEDEASEIRKVMETMEAELNEAGALNLDPTLDRLAALKAKSKGGDTANKNGPHEDSDIDSGSDNDLDIDFNLAKNLLESFKSQAGMAGPGGNLMGMMGMQLPRDEEDAQATTKKT